MLKSILTFGLICSASLVVWATDFFPPGDGHLALFNTHTEEMVDVVYRNEKGEYQQDALDQLQHVLRCRKDESTKGMSMDLIELIDHVQDHFGAGMVQVVSGYRSPEFNAELKKTGHRVAKHSRHMLGEAMDIRLPGVPLYRLKRYLMELKAGGVGYYPRKNFVHVDVGPYRLW